MPNSGASKFQIRIAGSNRPKLKAITEFWEPVQDIQAKMPKTVVDVQFVASTDHILTEFKGVSYAQSNVEIMPYGQGWDISVVAGGVPASGVTIASTFLVYS